MDKPTEKFSPVLPPKANVFGALEAYRQMGVGLRDVNRKISEAKQKGERIPDGLERECLDYIHAQVCKAMQWDVQVEGGMPEIDQKLPTLVLSNHTTIIGLWTPPQVLAEHYAWKSVAVGRESLSTVPFVGENFVQPMKVIKTGLFFDRDNGVEGKRQLQEGLAEVFVGNTGLWLFADGTRPYEKRIKAERERWEKRLGHDLPWLQRTPFPRRGGFHALVEGASQKGKFNLLNVTVAEVRDWEIGETIGISVKKENAAEVVSMTEEEKGNWLIGKWREKNKWILDFESGR
ncbi:MAG: hypothetical protein ACI9QC_000339 [Oceanicoccus sp.]|jgi:hypothetical protein